MSTDHIIPPTPGIEISRKILAHYARTDDPDRPHLGASVIGSSCARDIWLGWRWAVKRVYGKRNPEDPERERGRMLRLFKRGHREEAVFVGDLRAIGLDVHEFNPRTGKQWKYKTHAGHFGASLDGKVHGLAQSPSQPALLECKTYGAKYFEGLKASGSVQTSNERHYTQMQVYMRLAGLRVALYIAVCKDTDDLYTEIVEIDTAFADRKLLRARSIIESPEPPERISPDPTFWKCKMCDKFRQCRGDEMPRVNCRTCAFATPVTDRGENGVWRCEKWNADIPEDAQRKGCPAHVFIPALLDQHYEHVGGEAGHYTELRHKKTGVIVRNGAASEGVIASTELCVIDPAQMNDGIMQARAAFGGQFVEPEPGAAISADDMDDMQRIQEYWAKPQAERSKLTKARAWK